MSRYIEADAYRAKWADIFDSAYGDSCCEMFKKSIDEQPTADVVEVKHGEWIVQDGEVVCSECFEPNLETYYCPNCGADMIGGNNDIH